jgi:thiol-disulfide isomerase/thioredoxin
LIHKFLQTLFIMKTITLILFFFVSFFSYSQEITKTDTIIIAIEKNTKKAIDKYDNFFYLFPYVIVYDQVNLSGKELVNKHGLTDTLTLINFTTPDHYYVLKCKTLHQDIEVLIKKGDKVKIDINGNETKISILNRPTELYELKVDALLQKLNIEPNYLIKRYHNPVHFLSYEEAMTKGKVKVIALKKKSYRELPNRIRTAKKIIDSLESNGLISKITADFNRNKFQNQLRSIEILESAFSFDSSKTLINQIKSSNLAFPEKYNYKLVESFVNKYFVDTAKKIDFNDFTNRDYTEIYDNLNKSKLFKQHHQDFLLERELDRIIHFFPKSIGRKYYELFINSVSIPELKEEVKNKYLSHYIQSGDKSELLDLDNNTTSLKKIASQSKFTFVDFWASWCGPCRAEMPELKKVEKLYVDKGINFINLSIDENNASWKKAFKQIGLVEKNSFLLIDGFNSTLSKKYKITSIPRYMIMDEKGDFVLYDAPRPSEKRLITVLDGLLKKK